ncbi:SDR family NAD(P)-dependent oxidoreductase [Acidisoma sp.]|uniref:SDR family NAD(P)-dependent oxidoreductase n=1 Tax=Acidisoma sp. TaxID=1872115 RepID=UPI003B0006B6
MLDLESLSTIDFSVAGQRAFVTGGSRGIGFAVGAALKKFGADVVLGDQNADIGHAAAARIGARFVEVDVRSDSSVREAVSWAAGKEGVLDIAVNCAGVARDHNGQPIGPAEDVSDQTWDTLHALNMTGVFRCSREEGQLMLRRGRGAIVVDLKKQSCSSRS